MKIIYILFWFMSIFLLPLLYIYIYINVRCILYNVYINIIFNIFSIHVNYEARVFSFCPCIYNVFAQVSKNDRWLHNHYISRKQVLIVILLSKAITMFACEN